nr:hypothetical protein B0A51_14399 [Rachicladosporium sp. CCFEE 5018]
MHILLSYTLQQRLAGHSDTISADFAMHSSTLSGMLVAAGYILSAVPAATASNLPQDPRPAMPTSTASLAPPNFLDCVAQLSEIRLLLAGGCAMDVKEVNHDLNSLEQCICDHAPYYLDDGCMRYFHCGSGTNTLTSAFPIGPARTSYQQQLASIASVTPTASPAAKNYLLSDCVAQRIT